MNAATLSRLLRRLPRRRRLEAPLRVFLALSTVLLLCATVLHRDDADGFQASHLFFMPRHTWEMDHGIGMLYEDAYYQRMDLEVLAEEKQVPVAIDPALPYHAVSLIRSASDA